MLTREETAKFITDQPIDISLFVAEKPDPSCGAVATFFGVVRNHHKGRSVEKLYYECYPAMADKEIQRIVEQIKNQNKVHGIRVIHRIGWLEIGETAIAIRVNAPHRAEAFAACKAVIDQVKKTVPIWKKEIYTDGAADWILCSHQAVI